MGGLGKSQDQQPQQKFDGGSLVVYVVVCVLSFIFVTLATNQVAIASCVTGFNHTNDTVDVLKCRNVSLTDFEHTLFAVVVLSLGFISVCVSTVIGLLVFGKRGSLQQRITDLEDWLLTIHLNSDEPFPKIHDSTVLLVNK